jgi:hypothetical protein
MGSISNIGREVLQNQHFRMRYKVFSKPPKKVLKTELHGIVFPVLLLPAGFCLYSQHFG